MNKSNDAAGVGQAPGSYSNGGLREGVTTSEAQRVEELEREVKERLMRRRGLQSVRPGKV